MVDQYIITNQRVVRSPQKAKLVSAVPDKSPEASYSASEPKLVDEIAANVEPEVASVVNEPESAQEVSQVVSQEAAQEAAQELSTDLPNNDLPTSDLPNDDSSISHMLPPATGFADAPTSPSLSKTPEASISPHSKGKSEKTFVDGETISKSQTNENIFHEHTDNMFLNKEGFQEFYRDDNSSDAHSVGNISQISHDIASLEHAKEVYHESNPGDGTKAVDQHLTGLTLALTLFSCIASLFVTALDQTIVTTILTAVGSKFHGFEKVGWIMSGYLLPMAALAPSFGKISVAFGRKNVMLAGLLIFEVGSLISALASSMNMLIGGRVIQGIGSGAISSMVTVILTESVPINKRPISYMMIALTFSISSVLGPFIGGAFAVQVTWRWCFYINMPIGGAAALILFFCFNPPKPEGRFREKLASVDYFGTFLMTSGLILFMLALTFGGTDYPWKSAAVICCFVLSGLLLIAFTLWNFKYSEDPLLLKELFTNYKVLAPCLSGTFNFAFFLAALTYLATYFQIIFNATPWKSGLHLLPLLIAVTVATIFNGIFIKVTSLVKVPLVLSGILGCVGCGLLLLLDVDTSNSKQIGLLILVGVSIGLQFQPSMISSQLEAPREIEGSVIQVAVFLNFLRSIAAAMSVQIAQVIFQTTGSTNIKNLIASLPKDSADYEELSKYKAMSFISAPSLIQLLTPDNKASVLKELMKSFKAIFYFVLALSILSMVFSLFASNKRIPKEIATKQEIVPLNPIEVAAEKGTLDTSTKGSDSVMTIGKKV